MTDISGSMRTEKQVYKRIEQLEGLRQGMLNRIATYDYGGVPESLLINEREISVQIHELLWCVDNICPKCDGEDEACDVEYNYCGSCGNVWKQIG